MARLAPGAVGLDYGSGPGPTLSVLLEERGFTVKLYDPFFAPEEAALRRRYDFISCTETVEHFFDPRSELGRLARLLLPGGWLAIMTEIFRDPTHVCIYRPETMRWLASQLDWSLESPHPNVVFLRKTLIENPLTSVARARSLTAPPRVALVDRCFAR